MTQFAMPNLRQIVATTKSSVSKIEAILVANFGKKMSQ
jgi:hypothetical protein